MTTDDGLPSNRLLYLVRETSSVHGSRPPATV
jgi:hypothetical protein